MCISAQMHAAAEHQCLKICMSLRVCHLVWTQTQSIARFAAGAIFFSNSLSGVKSTETFEGRYQQNTLSYWSQQSWISCSMNKSVFCFLRRCKNTPMLAFAAEAPCCNRANDFACPAGPTANPPGQRRTPYRYTDMQHTTRTVSIHTHTHTRLMALFREYPGEPVPER